MHYRVLSGLEIIASMDTTDFILKLVGHILGEQIVHEKSNDPPITVARNINVRMASHGDTYSVGGAWTLLCL